MGRRSFFIATCVCLSLVASAASGKVELEHYYTAAEKLVSADVPMPEGRMQDLELYWIALTLDALGETSMGLQYLQYLQEYYPRSPLQTILPRIPSDTPYLPHFDLDPELSRLIKTIYRRIATNGETSEDPAFGEGIALLTLQIDALLQGGAEAGWEKFLEQYPDSIYSGWAAYQLACKDRQRQGGDSRALRSFWMANPEHPLGREAAEALDVKYYSPERLSFLSALLPGLGEETLEPGMRESSSVMYSEVLFLAGTIGFAIAAQANSRVENLTGALIIGNFLLLNHKGSADKTSMLAQRRNMAEQRLFQSQRIDQPVFGPGGVKTVISPSADDPGLGNDLTLSLAYQAESLASGLRGTGYVQDSQLVNLGFRAEYSAMLLTVPVGSNWDIGIAAIPFGRMFLNHAEKNPDSSLGKGMALQEYGAGAELALLTRWSYTEGFLQLRLSAGPAVSMRALSLDGREVSAQEAVPSACLALDWGGLSGSFWHAGVCYETGKTVALDLDGEKLDLPGRSLGYVFGLGIHF